MIVVMEIIYKTNNEKSNFSFCSEIEQNSEILNGFNKLNEIVLCEPIAWKEFDCQNVFFDKKIKANLYLCYPFSVVTKTSIEFDSLHSLISEIREAYKEIYKHEKNTSTKIEKKNKNLINRGKSNGEIGIWGHVIYDLVIESIRVGKNQDEIIVTVGIGS